MRSSRRSILAFAMAERLLVVEDAFVVRGTAVLLMPRFSTADPPRGSFPVRLVRPDGTEVAATASVDVAHMRGPSGAFAMYRLEGVTPADVPKGTELWRDSP